MSSLSCLPWLQGTKLSALFLSIPLAIGAYCLGFGPTRVFTLSSLGPALLARHVNFLTELLACFSGPTVGVLLNIAFGNGPAIFGDVVKCSLMGFFVLSLLLVIGDSLYYGGTVKLSITYAFKDGKLDITLRVTLDSVTRISTFAVPLCVITAWLMGIKIELKDNEPEIGFLTLNIEGITLPLRGWLASFLLGRDIELHFRRRLHD